MPTDHLLRFLLTRSGVRGVLVQLGESWRSVVARGSYPAALESMLGQSLAAAALFAGHVKLQGRVGVQLKGRGALRTLFADCTSAGALRGIALWQDPLPQPLTPRSLGSDALLAITIEQQHSTTREPTRHQGLVGLDADHLAAAFEGYFTLSEQLPTRILLAADTQRAAGLLLQQLPGQATDDDDWPRTQALFETLGSVELLGTASDVLLHRLFHEEGYELQARRPLHFACSCSREHVGQMWLALGDAEARAAIQPEQGCAEVVCEFCGSRYRFDAVDFDLLFAGGGSAEIDPVRH